MTEFQPTDRIQTPSVIGAVGLLVTIPAFALAGGIEASLLAIVLVPVWFFLSSIYVVALGHVLLAAFATEPTVITVLAIELGLFIMLADAASVHSRPGTLFSTTVFAAAGLVLLVAMLLVLDGRLWVSAVALLVTLTVFAYGLHRYELVTLEMIDHG